MANEPDAKNDLAIKTNPTATVTAVCQKPSDRDYSQAIHAACYSEINQAIVVLISGKPKGTTEQAVAKHLLIKFEKAYIPAVAYLRFPELDGIGITFLLNGDPYGPYSGENWIQGFETVKVHAPQAWHQD